MGTRSRYMAAAAVAAGVVSARARRRARLRRAAEGVREAIMPTHVADLPTEPVTTEDEAHAPGHRHLPRPGRAGRAGRRVPRSYRGRGGRHRLADR